MIFWGQSAVIFQFIYSKGFCYKYGTGLCTRLHRVFHVNPSASQLKYFNAAFFLTENTKWFSAVGLFFFSRRKRRNLRKNISAYLAISASHLFSRRKRRIHRKNSSAYLAISASHLFSHRKRRNRRKLFQRFSAFSARYFYTVIVSPIAGNNKAFPLLSKYALAALWSILINPKVS